jgi:hypothetical protein
MLGEWGEKYRLGIWKIGNCGRGFYPAEGTPDRQKSISESYVTITVRGQNSPVPFISCNQMLIYWPSAILQ